MKNNKLFLYHVDMKYIRDLAKTDDNVMSVSPQVNKEMRPFVGVVIIHDNLAYCIPLSSPKEKHRTMKNDRDFSKIVDKKGKLIGVLNFNNMIPVFEDVLHKVDIRVRSSDDPGTKAYKGLLNDQLDWCNANREAIEKKGGKLYDLIIYEKGSYVLRKRCCDFRKLERVMEKWKNK